MRRWFGGQPTWVALLAGTLLFGLLNVAWQAAFDDHIDWLAVVVLSVLWGAFMAVWTYRQKSRRAG